jgi:hypothetical protein
VVSFRRTQLPEDITRFRALRTVETGRRRRSPRSPGYDVPTGRHARGAQWDYLTALRRVSSAL